MCSLPNQAAIVGGSRDDEIRVSLGHCPKRNSNHIIPTTWRIMPTNWITEAIFHSNILNNFCFCECVGKIYLFKLACYLFEKWLRLLCTSAYIYFLHQLVARIRQPSPYSIIFGNDTKYTLNSISIVLPNDYDFFHFMMDSRTFQQYLYFFYENKVYFLR